MTQSFVPPAWLVSDRGHGADVRDLLSGASLRFEGAAARAVLDGELGPVRALARLDPTVCRFVRDLESSPSTPMTRSAVLRGEGWRQLFIELGARCNERCVHCYAESSPERSDELPLALVLRALDDAKALGFRAVQLTGGDPLIAASCLPAAEHAARLGFEELEIYTNGLALRGTLFERLRALEPRFAFSFYSHDPAVHDAITQTPGSQRRTADAIRCVLDAGLRARVGIIALESNHRDLERTVAFVRALGVAPEAIAVDVQRGVGRGEFAAQSFAWPLPQTGAPTAGHREAPGSRGFGGTACVGYDGRVYPCIFSRHLPLGDLRQASLRELLEDPAPVALSDLELDTHAWSDRLGCVECRIRSSILAGSPPGSRLVRLWPSRRGELA